MILYRAVGRSENPGVPVLFGGHYLPPLVGIGLTDLPTSGGAPPGTTGLSKNPKFVTAIRGPLYLHQNLKLHLKINKV